MFVLLACLSFLSLNLWIHHNVSPLQENSFQTKADRGQRAALNGVGLPAELFAREKRAQRKRYGWASVSYIIYIYKPAYAFMVGHSRVSSVQELTPGPGQTVCCRISMVATVFRLRGEPSPPVVLFLQSSIRDTRPIIRGSQLVFFAGCKRLGSTFFWFSRAGVLPRPSATFEFRHTDMRQIEMQHLFLCH